MSTYNSATIIGRLGGDPQVRYTQSNTAVANLSVATSERYKDRNGEVQEKTTWHDIVAWGRTAEIAQEYLKKGDLVHITGPIEKRPWTDKDGNERVSVEIKALTMTMLGSAGGERKPAESNTPAKTPVVLGEQFDGMDDELPFIWALIPFGYTLIQLVM